MALIKDTLEDWKYAYKCLEKKEMEQRTTIKRLHMENIELKRQLRSSQNASTSDGSLPIADVVLSEERTEFCNCKGRKHRAAKSGVFSNMCAKCRRRIA